MSLENFAQLPHALVTLRRDVTGCIDEILATHDLKRKIAVTTSHMLVLPSLIASSNLIASIPSRIATHVECYGELQQFELPITLECWTVSMFWSKLVDKDSANIWLRNTIKTLCTTL